MAPYAVAHFKLGMLLAGYDLPKEQQKQWRYDFEAEERLGIYLTNTLDEAPMKMAEALWGLRILSEEANAASRVKRDLPIMVVLGNPPYSANSANKGNWIIDLIHNSYYPNDEIKEHNPKFLLDDYVKFLRWGEWRIDRTGNGVMAVITNHGYLENPTFRRMRKNLMENFNEIYILNLHGSVKKREHSTDGSKDENVFDIQQGVAISIFIKNREKTKSIEVHHAELWGTREAKYEWLMKSDISKTNWSIIKPQSPFYSFSLQDDSLMSEYTQSWKITEILPKNSTGVKTHRDSFVMGFDPNKLKDRIQRFRNLTIPDNEIYADYGLQDTRDWKLKERRQSLALDSQWDRFFTECLYRPFDVRYYYHNDNVVELPRQEIMRHVFPGSNICLSTTRSVEIGRGWEHVLCSSRIIQHHTVSLKEVNYLFPLYIINNEENRQVLFQEVNWPPGKDGRIPNLNPDFVSAFASRLGLEFVSDGHGNLATTFGPEDIFDYIYAVFHSPTYRQRYAEFLKIDFPRVPMTASLDLFRKLCILGEELVALHLLESPYLSQLITRYPVVGDNIVEKGFPKFVSYEERAPGYVYINKIQYFEGVPREVWEFHVGGYQVCEKWLKDRRGRQLSFDDLMHYQKVVVALRETIRLMAEIDKAIPGWPIE